MDNEFEGALGLGVFIVCMLNETSTRISFHFPFLLVNCELGLQGARDEVI